MDINELKVVYELVELMQENKIGYVNEVCFDGVYGFTKMEVHVYNSSQKYDIEFYVESVPVESCKRIEFLVSLLNNG